MTELSYGASTGCRSSHSYVGDAAAAADNTTHQQDAHNTSTTTVAMRNRMDDNSSVSRPAPTPTPPANSTLFSPAIRNPYAASSTSASTKRRGAQLLALRKNLATNSSTVNGPLPPTDSQASSNRHSPIIASTPSAAAASVHTKVAPAETTDASVTASNSRPDTRESSNPYKRKRQLQDPNQEEHGATTTMLSKEIERPSTWIPVLENPYRHCRVVPTKRSNTNEPSIEGRQLPDDGKKQVSSSTTTTLSHAQPAIVQGSAEQSAVPHSKAMPLTPQRSTSTAHSVLRNPYLQQTRKSQVSTPKAAAVPSPMGTIIRNPYQATATTAAASAKRLLWNKSDNHQTANETLASAGQPVAPSESASALIISAADKAGMDGIDRAAIDAIILQVSGNSAYMQQQRKRDSLVNNKIAALRTKLAQRQQQHSSLPSLPQQHQFQHWINARSPRSVTVVVDMDMFFMACELLHRPDITPTTPAVVGGSSMILTSNYAARRFGVRSAMPGYIGAALVERLSQGKEQLVFCASNFDLYKRKSGIVQSALREYDPRHFSMMSLDEASLDITQYLLCRLQHPEWTHQQISSTLQEGNPPDGSGVINEQQQLLSFSNEDCIREAAQIVSEMRSAVVRATGGLTCSAGLAPNRLLAKIASDQNKPNGQCVVGSSQDEVTGFLHPLPIRKVSGVGRVTEKLLRAFGVTTVLQLYLQRNLVSFLFDPTSKITQFLLQASIGCSAADGRRDVDGNSNNKQQQQKGISRSRTFQPIPWSEVASKIEDIGCMLAGDMQRKKIKAKTVSLQIKFDTYTTLSRAKTLASPLWTATDLIRVAVDLKREMGHQTHQVRLVGISCTNFLDPTLANQSTMDRFLIAQGDGAQAPRVREELSVAQDNPYLSPKAPDTSTETTSIPCPVCQRRFPSASAVSDHIDACLNGAVVRKLVQEENVNQKHSNSRKKRNTTLRTYFQQSPQQATESE